jgi:hypothetical protein
LPLLTSSEGNRRMFVDEHLAEWCLVCCFLGVLGLRVTAAQTYNGRRFLLFGLLDCEGCFGSLFLLFLWLRIPVMGAGNSFCFVAHGGWGSWD